MFLNASSVQGASLDRQMFTSQVITYTGLALAFTAFMAWITPMFIPLEIIVSTPFFVISLCVQLGIVFTANYWAKDVGIVSLLLYAIYCALNGVIVSFLTAALIGIGGMPLLYQALGTVVLFALIAGIGSRLFQVNLRSLSMFLMFATLTLIVVSLFNLFFFSSQVSLVTSGVGILLFTLWLYFDIRMLENYPVDRPLFASIMFYISLMGLVVHVFNFFILSNND